MRCTGNKLIAVAAPEVPPFFDDAVLLQGKKNSVLVTPGTHRWLTNDVLLESLISFEAHRKQRSV